MSTVMILAGGTGGHVYPALAVAGLLREHGIQVLWMGTENGIENRVVPKAGFELLLITIKGIRGSGLRRKLQMPWLLLQAMWQSLQFFRERRPDVVLGMGGFAAGPGGLVAWLLRRPLLIHEANAVFGLTNRLLSKLAVRVMTGFEKTEPIISDALFVGNPLRQEFLSASQAIQQESHDGLRLLIVGGSQGALSFNEVLPGAISLLQPEPIEVWHQCGMNRQQATLDNYRGAGLDARVTEFIEDMVSAYQWADIIVCRAGAMTIAELEVVKRAAILVPYPYAAGDHQARNAQVLVDAEAAIVLRHEFFTPENLAREIRLLINEPGRIQQLAERIGRLAKPQATRRVTEICMEVMRA